MPPPTEPGLFVTVGMLLSALGVLVQFMAFVGGILAVYFNLRSQVGKTASKVADVANALERIEAAGIGTMQHSLRAVIQDVEALKSDMKQHWDARAHTDTTLARLDEQMTAMRESTDAMRRDFRLVLDELTRVRFGRVATA